MANFVFAITIFCVSNKERLFYGQMDRGKEKKNLKLARLFYDKLNHTFLPYNNKKC